MKSIGGGVNVPPLLGTYLFTNAMKNSQLGSIGPQRLGKLAAPLLLWRVPGSFDSGSRVEMGPVGVIAWA
jgi:hypothetical protein